MPWYWPFGKSEVQQLREQVELERLSLEQDMLQEGRQLFIDTFVNPHDAFRDPHGGPDWVPVGSTGRDAAAAFPFASDGALAEIRKRMRQMERTNPFARSGFLNLKNFTVGTGYTYTVSTRDQDQSESLKRDIEAAQRAINRFMERNSWSQFEQEIVQRTDRDGEAFIRRFPDGNGGIDVRIVEPGQVRTPEGRTDSSFGIQTSEDDVQTVEGYWVDGRFVEAAEIDHLKVNVDRNVKRGLPSLWAARNNLERAMKLLRNMGSMANTQAAIAMIRKYPKGTPRAKIRALVDDSADYRIQNTGHFQKPQEQRFKQLFPGTILDAIGHEYDFPHANVNASAYVDVLQAELRAAAASVALTEFIFTADASNSNFASTLVAEGTSVRQFQTRQAFFTQHFRHIMWGVLREAQQNGSETFTADFEELLEIQIETPSLVVRNRLEEARANQIEFLNGVLSPQTWSARSDLDYKTEQMNKESHLDAFGGPMAMPGGDDEEEDDDSEE